MLRRVTIWDSSFEKSLAVIEFTDCKARKDTCDKASKMTVVIGVAGISSEARVGIDYQGCQYCEINSLSRSFATHVPPTGNDVRHIVPNETKN